MPDSDSRTREWGERTTADLSSLLVELGRALRGLGFYREGSPVREDLLERAFLAFQGELERAGPLELWVEEARIRATGIRDGVAHGHLADLAARLQSHDVERVQFTPELSRDAFCAFVELLNLAEQGLRHHGGFARGLAARSSAGIVINGGEDDALAALQSLSSTPPMSTASLGSALLARSRRLIVEPGLGMRRAPCRDSDEQKPALEASPLEAAVGDERGERLLFRLIELDRCSDDAAYEFLGKRIVEWARDLSEEGLADECYRTILVLADHAVGDGGRSGLQARVAGTLCRELATGERLSNLIDRACSTNVSAGVRATQVLLQLGEPAIGPIVERLASEQSSTGVAQLTAILITLGETALPCLETLMRDPSDARAGLAVRLAGELQNPAQVPRLRAVLQSSRTSLHRDAAHALVHVGGNAAADALIDALASPQPGVPDLAATCLASLRNPRAAQPLLASLDQALRQGEYEGARRLIHSLGRLGSERAVPKLVAILERRAIVRRKPLRELKLAALGALREVSGREAYRALRRATRSRDARLRARAEQLLADAKRAPQPEAE